jgi:hypothetical protein
LKVPIVNRLCSISRAFCREPARHLRLKYADYKPAAIESERVRAAQALDAGDYVRKPYVIEKLGLAVRKELDRIK